MDFSRVSSLPLLTVLFNLTQLLSISHIKRAIMPMFYGARTKPHLLLEEPVQVTD